MSTVESISGSGSLADQPVFVYMLFEENTYLIPANWATRNLLLYVSQKVLPGVEVLAGSCFLVILRRSLLSLAPSRT